jgi:type II secretory pathway pseudopilin PulG
VNTALSFSLCLLFAFAFGCGPTKESIKEELRLEAEAKAELAQEFVADARVAAAKDYLMQIRMTIRLYQRDTGSFPQSLNDLWKKPAAVEKWSGPYFESALQNDPWRNAYSITIDGDKFTLRSLGPDGVQSGDDILVSGP